MARGTGGSTPPHLHQCQVIFGDFNKR